MIAVEMKQKRDVVCFVLFRLKVDGNEKLVCAYPDGFLFEESGLFLLFRLLLELVVRHGDDSEDEVEQIEGAQEDDDDEEEHVPRTGRPQDELVEVLPVVLHHEPEGREKGPAEAVERCVPVIRVVSVALQARVVLWARPRFVTQRHKRSLHNRFESTD